MLIRVDTLKGYTLGSLDGEIGKAKEFYFDDQHWTIRYLVADTGNWLTGRQVLLSPYALAAVNKEKKQIAIDLTKEQIENSPALETDMPVSRQFEEAYFDYYEWPLYWDGSFVWGSYPNFARHRKTAQDAEKQEKAWDPHLRSTRAVSGYHIQATDGEIGHVEDFIIDDQTWTIRYLIINTQNWWPGKKVLVSPQWIEQVSWQDSKVFVTLSRETIRRSPEYTDWSMLTREFEVALHRYYKCEGYWDTEAAAK